ncbi:MAG: hypothetical protein ACFBSG_17965 [Leptolyngbyaceae cyanobacterium]
MTQQPNAPLLSKCVEDDGGICYPEKDPLTVDAIINGDRVELLQMLRRIHPDALEEVIAALPINQRNLLRRVLSQPQT